VSSGKEIPIAVLVCDIRQFTPFVNAHLPYDVYHILNRFLGEIGEPILLNGGFIYQYIGDQIVGLFGVKETPAEQSCLAAVRAGLGMIHALERLNDRIEEEYGVRLGVRIGAHFGSLITGYMGHPLRREFSVVGDAINVASRIEGANEASMIRWTSASERIRSASRFSGFGRSTAAPTLKGR
jgi:class 3 adenylate cyclase